MFLFAKVSIFLDNANYFMKKSLNVLFSYSPLVIGKLMKFCEFVEKVYTCEYLGVRCN